MPKIKNSARSSQEHSSISSCSSSSSDEEEIDARDLKPIKDYLSNRKELAQQLFKSVKPEKIRMMLPQILKQMDLNELEEWCVSELNGMSKSRILSILNGKPMLESSNTSESDDSGPSLEIISDTEEWPTDDDASRKENGKGKLKKDKTKVKKRTQSNKKNDANKSNVKIKCNIKSENVDKTKDMKIKKEDDKDKGKDADNLLDLLELEMRARAIRALIRKEEDIIPSTNSQEMNDGQTIENNVETSQNDDKAKENCRKQLEKIISAQQSNKGEDEDVVLVIQPTPVVELSSDSDGEVCEETHVKQKLKNEGATDEKSTSNSENARKSSSQDSKERSGTQEVTGTHDNTNTVTKVDLSTRSETRTIMPERNVDIKNNTLSISISADNVAEKRKRSKKKSHTKSQFASSASENSSKLKEVNIIETTRQSMDIEAKNIKEHSTISFFDENEVSAEEASKTKEKESRIEDEKSADLDEIIDLDDLDDYCDVMDIENCDDDKSQDKDIASSQQENEQSASQDALPKSDSTETWASRYYQTDDVQNVIKESKIQSEIRKRLRERQRLSKLNKSPNLNSSSQSSATDATVVSSENTPTGSVEEYLALKRATIVNVDTDPDTNSDNNTIIPQDNSATINTTDVSPKEISAQEERISSPQECTDNDAQAATISEVTAEITAEPIEIISDTKNDDVTRLV